MKYLVELNEGYTQQSVMHLGKCSAAKSLQRFVVVDSPHELSQMRGESAIKNIVKDFKVTPLTMRTVNWTLSSGYIEDIFNVPTGKGVNIYVQDGGIARLDDLAGRVRRLRTPQTPNSDIYHGTAVASMAAGRFYGVAYNANVIDVQTDFWLTDIMDGYDAILTDHLKSNVPSVLNISYGYYGMPEMMMSAVRQLAESGILIVAAVGNDGLDYVCDPASSPYVVSVGSTNINGEMSSFSNRGDQVDIYAGGEDVILAAPNRLRYDLFSGTSFSAPYIAGMYARLLEGHDKPTTWEEVVMYRDILLKRSDTVKMRSLVPVEVMDNHIAGMPQRTLRSYKDIAPTKSQRQRSVTHIESTVRPLQKRDECDGDNSSYWLLIVLAILIIAIIVIILLQKRSV